MVSLPRSLRVLTYFIVMLIMNAGLLQAQTKRRAVIEEYTGAWCQYCPSGAVAFDQLSNNYTEEEVIMCAVHNGDGMALSNDADFAQFRNGFPSGAINRAQFGISPGAWAGAVAGIIAQDASVDVILKNIVFNSSTRRVTFDLEARFLKDVTGEVRVNVMVIEDSVVGSGSAYDQVNAFNTQSGHPFFGKGNPVKNYAHRHVVRLFQDGSWGASGAVPNNPKAGAIYKKSYSISMNASWVPSRISLVGTVNKYNIDIAQREILNAVQESLTIRSTRATLAGVDSPYLIIAAGAKQTYKVNVTNENKVNLDFAFAVNETKSTIPSDWTATVEPASLNLDPGASGEITITVEAPKSFTQAELASITIEALPSEATNTKPKKQIEDRFSVRIPQLNYAPVMIAKAFANDKLPIDILVNIAGMTKDAITHMVTMDQMKLIFEINFFSQIYLTQFVTKLMIRQGYGSVVNTSSISAIDGSYGQLSYSSSKAALIGATKTLSKELASKGVRVNAIAPGVISTDMNKIVPDSIIQENIKKMKIKRLGKADEVAKTILFLASDLSNYITGQIIRIDGGIK